MVRRIIVLIVVLLLPFSLICCGVQPSDVETVSASAQTVSTPAVTPSPAIIAPTSTPEPPAPTPTPEPTPEVPESLGSGDVLFDIYRYKAVRDLNFDGIDEIIEFAAGEAQSTVTINGTTYNVVHEGLAQLFAITDVNKDDGTLEIVFTDAYNPTLPEGEFAFSWLYWWSGYEAIGIGSLMDVKFDGEWRAAFNPLDHFDGANTVTFLAETDELTHVYYMGRFHKSDENEGMLEETAYATPVVGEPVTINCKQPCLLLEDITKDYYNSAYDYYWIPTLWPYTAGRVPNVDEGIEIIAQTGEKLTIVKVYGKRWFKLRTSDGYAGWIRCENHEIDAYAFTMGWDADDMFSGL